MALKQLTLICFLAFFVHGISSHRTLSGVNLGGFLLIEEWMFSFGMFDRVTELDNVPQGVVMPPLLPDGFGQNWFSEGDLVAKLVWTFGQDTAVDVIQAHRHSYISQTDISLMKKAGVEVVRLPVGWWAFVDESASDKPVVIPDPAHPDKMFVTISQSFLRDFISNITKAGMKVLIDIHAFPGGSSVASYSGVYPSPAVFFAESSLMKQGLDIVTNLCSFYLSLDADVRSMIEGLTLMNEPAHGLAQYSGVMQRWMTSAVGVFRKMIDPMALPAPPKLYVNFIETSINAHDILKWFDETFTQGEKNTYAVLDIHSYFAWNGGADGCYSTGCAYKCSDDATKAGSSKILGIIETTAFHTHDYFTSNGTVPMISCTEFSLATWQMSRQACRSKQILDYMFNAQTQGFADQNLYSALFWTWRMPFGGAHEYAWSLKRYLGLEN